MKGLKINFGLLIFAACYLAAPALWASGQESRLFHIERSRDANIVVYTLNLDPQGYLDTKNPVQASWLMLAKQGQTEPLTLVQRRYGYGLRYISREKEQCSFELVSLPDKPLTLKRNQQGHFKVFVESEEGEVVVEKIAIQFEDDSFWSPAISGIQLFGKLLPDMVGIVVPISKI